MTPTKETSKKGKTKVISPPRGVMPREGISELLGFTRAFFDTGLQREFSKYLQEGGRRVKVTGKGSRAAAAKEDKVKITMGERSKFANPAISNVESAIGLYNPEVITVDTFELMKKDPTISAGLAFIKLPIVALPWRILSESEEVSAFCTYAMKRVWGRLIRSTLTAVDYGFSSHEKVFEFKKVNIYQRDYEGKKKTYFNGRALLYKKFKSHYPDSIRVKLDDKENFIGIIQEEDSGGGKVELDKNKCFFFTHEEEFGNVFGKSRLVPAYKFWYWKEVLYQFMLMYYERRGSPAIVVTAPPGESLTGVNTRKNNLELALDLGSSLLSSSIAAIPYEPNKSDRENMWNVAYLNDDKRGEMFIQAINHLDACILRALWIPESTIVKGEGTGSYGMSSVHADLFLQSELGLVNDIEVAINEQVLPILVQGNFVPAKQDDVYIKFDSIDWNRKIALKEIFIEMMRNIDNFVQVGLRPHFIPSLEKLADVLNIPIEEWTEAIDDEGIELPEGAKEGNGEEGKGGEAENAASNAQNASKNVAKLPTSTKPGGKAVPRRERRTSFTGSRAADRRYIQPGGKRAEQMRAKLTEPLPEIAAAGPGYETGYYPTMSAPLSEHLRIELIRMCQVSDGLLAVKSGLMRIKIWAGADLIEMFEFMGTEELSKAITNLQDFQIMVLYEAITKRLSDSDDNSIKQALAAALKTEEDVDGKKKKKKNKHEEGTD